MKKNAIPPRPEGQGILAERMMKKNNLECEFTSKDLENFGFDAVSEEVLSHVFYHAEMNGFSIEEHLVR